MKSKISGSPIKIQFGDEYEKPEEPKRSGLESFRDTLENEDDKVYCEDCRYSSFLRYNTCFYKEKEYRNLDINVMYFGQNDNDEGECKNYKRKWWKFWR